MRLRSVEHDVEWNKREPGLAVPEAPEVFWISTEDEKHAERPDEVKKIVEEVIHEAWDKLPVAIRVILGEEMIREVGILNLEHRGDESCKTCRVAVDISHGMLVVNSSAIEAADMNCSGLDISMVRMLARAYLFRLRAWALAGYLKVGRAFAGSDPESHQRTEHVCTALMSHGARKIEGFEDAVPEHLWDPDLLDRMEAAIAHAWGFSKDSMLPNNPSLN